MPLMSVIVITPDDLGTVARTIAPLRAQTARRDLELVLVGPGVARQAAASGLASDFAAVRTVDIEDMRSTARARAAGIRAATAPVVVLTEDHSFPDPGWAEALLDAHKAEWAVVGPAVVNANPDSLVSWANLVIEYGEWLDPAPAGPCEHLPGHNSAYKRDVLLALGERLEQFLEAESLLHWHLRALGHNLYLEPRARTRHLNFSRLTSSLALRYHCGHMFAGVRAAQWPAYKRAAYAAASPMIPLVRLARIARQLRRSGRRHDLVPRLFPLLLFLLAVDAGGELTGYLFGPGQAPAKIADIDFHRERYLNRRDREQFEAR
jgi:hypothetical protein